MGNDLSGQEHQALEQGLQGTGHGTKPVRAQEAFGQHSDSWDPPVKCQELDMWPSSSSGSSMVTGISVLKEIYIKEFQK